MKAPLFSFALLFFALACGGGGGGGGAPAPSGVETTTAAAALVNQKEKKFKSLTTDEVTSGSIFHSEHGQMSLRTTMEHTENVSGSGEMLYTGADSQMKVRKSSLDLDANNDGVFEQTMIF
jgi:hypothetical protein